MFLDASVLVAILTEEPEQDTFLSAIEKAEVRATSAIAIYEASHAVARKSGRDLAQTYDLVLRFLDGAGIVVRPATSEVGREAVLASARYGKHSGHPAKLNMGDCFSYAMAREASLPLLYKGDDFARTDLA